MFHSRAAAVCFSRHLRRIIGKETRRLVGNGYKNCPFGLLLDIDGVLCRGNKLLPGTVEAVNLLTNSDGEFVVPTVFVTNAGSVLRINKALELSKKLGVQVCRDQVVMCHSPLRMFSDFHDKHVLVVGQGPLREIANAVGFTRVTTMENLVTLFPHLNCIDRKSRRAKLNTKPYTLFYDSYPPIEAIVLLGEPTHWEAALQLLIDVLMTGGKPACKNVKRGEMAYPHIPVLACNMDLLYMAETCLPRFTHGTFLLCLETLYKTLTGHDLKYTALMGKPSTITYLHAAYVAKQIAAKMGMATPANLYAIGDNPESDILGANLYDLFLQRKSNQPSCSKQAMGQSAQWGWGKAVTSKYDYSAIGLERHYHDVEGDVRKCHSVLVETGVYSKKCQMNRMGIHHSMLPHSAVLKPEYESLKQATFVEKDFLGAVKMIYNRERWHPYIITPPVKSAIA